MYVTDQELTEARQQLEENRVLCATGDQLETVENLVKLLEELNSIKTGVEQTLHISRKHPNEITEADINDTKAALKMALQLGGLF